MKWTITYTNNGETIIEEYFDYIEYENRINVLLIEINKVDAIIENLYITSGSNA